MLPDLGGMDQFKAAETPRPTVQNPGFFSPIAFRPTDGGENPLLDKERPGRARAQAARSRSSLQACVGVFSME